MGDGRVRIEAVRAVRSACRAMEKATDDSVPSESEEQGAVLLDGMMTIFQKSEIDFGEAVLILRRGEAMVPFYLNTGEIKIMEEDPDADGPVQFVVEIETGQQFKFDKFIDMMQNTNFAFSFEVAKPAGTDAQIRVQNLRIYGGSLDGSEAPDQSIYASGTQDPYQAPQPMYPQQQQGYQQPQQPQPRRQPPQQGYQHPQPQQPPRRQPPQQQQGYQQPQPRQQPQQQPRQQPQQQPRQQPRRQSQHQQQAAREQQRMLEREEQARSGRNQVGDIQLHQRREYSGPGM